MNAARARLAAVAVTVLTVLCAVVLIPGQAAEASTYVPISGSGSTWSYNAIHQWIANVAQLGVTVNYAPVG